MNAEFLGLIGRQANAAGKRPRPLQRRDPPAELLGPGGPTRPRPTPNGVSLWSQRYSAREVNIRYGSDTPRVVRSSTQNAEISVRPADSDALPAAAESRRVEPGQQPLRSGFLVAGWCRLSAPPETTRPLPWSPASASARAGRRGRIRWHSQAGQCGHLPTPGSTRPMPLDILRQRGRDAVGIDRVVIQPLRLKE